MEHWVLLRCLCADRPVCTPRDTKQLSSDRKIVYSAAFSLALLLMEFSSSENELWLVVDNKLDFNSLNIQMRFGEQ